MNPNSQNNRSLRPKRTTPTLNQIYHLSKPKQEIIKVQSKNDEIIRNEKITEIYNSEFEDYFQNILLLSKDDFLKEISYRIELIIKELFTEEEIKEKSFKDFITESNKIINEKYQNNYNILSKSYNNYLKRPKNFSYLKHFRKHCIHTDDFAYHSCEYENSKLIEIKDEKNKNEITHFICSNCKKSYFPNQISLICNYCKINYFSCLLNKDEDPNIQPATWEKYHCQNLINETMKCLKCKNILYLNIRENKLICLNKKCNFIAKPQSIIWNCLICKKEFKSDAKIYNPLEIKIMKRSVHLALIFKKPIFPNEIPCCKANPKELIFYHKNDCKGELFEGIFNNKIIIVCSKCHAVNFYDKFIWTCPLCKKRFRTSIIRSNTNDKFISFRTSELNSNFSNFINNYNSDYNPMLRSISGENKFLNSFHSTMRYTTSFNDNKNHIVNLVTEVYPNDGKNNNDNNNNDNKQIKNKKQYSTLIEILAERNNNKILDNNNSNFNIVYNNSNNNSRVNSRKNRFKKNYSEVNLEEKDNINKIVNENNNKDNIIIVNNNNENNHNEINLNALRKVASVSTNDHSLSNKSYGNSSNPPTNKIKKITVNKNENNNDDDESILNVNNPISKIRSRRLRNRNENDNILNNRKESKNLEEENNNNNNNSQISIRKQLESQINKRTEKSMREKERENKKEKSQEIYKKPNKEIEDININTPEKNQLNTLIPNKNKRRYDITPPKLILLKKNEINNKKEKKDNENNENNEEDIFTSPEQLKEVIKNGKIPLFNIENFIFKNPIGEGSFGKIYLIQKEKTHEKYALKKIICHDIEEIKHFQKEFELVYSKVHNNIMKIYNIEYKCLDSTTYSIYVLMELANSDWNNEIKRRLKKREYYTESEIVKLLNQILDALIFLEKNGIAHRDIKPQNILIYPNNIYKVADFGEARNLSDSIQECTLRGSELYMSPVLYNCLKNRQRDVIHNAYKSDVFSLGYCLLYAMVLTVKVLNDIREINDMNVISLIIKKALRRNYSIKMQELITGMLQLDENKRFSFEEIKKYLKENFLK